MQYLPISSNTSHALLIKTYPKGSLSRVKPLKAMKFIYCLCGVALLFLCSLENAAVTVSASERETKHATCVCLYMHHAACMHAILKRSADRVPAVLHLCSVRLPLVCVAARSRVRRGMPPRCDIVKRDGLAFSVTRFWFVTAPHSATGASY